MSKITMGSGGVFVNFDDGTERMVREALERAAPGVVAIIEDALGKIHADALKQWPVGPEKKYRKGRHSRDELYTSVVLDPDGTTIRGRIWCTAEWAKYIKPKGLEGKSAYVELLRKPFRAQRVPLTQSLAKTLSIALGGD